MNRIDGKPRRKPGSTPGVVVALADGQEWTLALPRLRLSPRRFRRMNRFSVELDRGIRLNSDASPQVGRAGGPVRLHPGGPGWRSEERRVGKEGRAGLSGGGVGGTGWGL